MTAGQALLVMDVQRAIVERYADTDPGLLDRIHTALVAARRAELPVIYVVVRFRPGHPEVSDANAGFAAVKESGLFTEDDPDTAIHPAVAPEPGDVVVTKRRVSAFAGSDLEEVLRAARVERLVLTGIATSGVVLSTLTAAVDRDYATTVLSDGCVDPDPEVHRVLVDKVFARRGEVRTIADWVASL